MLKSIGNIVKIAIAAVAVGGMTAPAMAQSWGKQQQVRFDQRYDRDWNRGGANGGGYRFELVGNGVARLHPVLKTTREGLRFVSQFDYNRDGRLNMNEAGEANRALIRGADRNGDANVSDREAARFLR